MCATYHVKSTPVNGESDRTGAARRGGPAATTNDTNTNSDSNNNSNNTNNSNSNDSYILICLYMMYKHTYIYIYTCAPVRRAEVAPLPADRPTAAAVAEVRMLSSIISIVSIISTSTSSSISSSTLGISMIGVFFSDYEYYK